MYESAPAEAGARVTFPAKRNGYSLARYERYLSVLVLLTLITLLPGAILLPAAAWILLLLAGTLPTAALLLTALAWTLVRLTTLARPLIWICHELILLGAREVFSHRTNGVRRCPFLLSELSCPAATSRYLVGGDFLSAGVQTYFDLS